MNSEYKNQETLERIRAKGGFICDMDGVIYHGNKLLPGAMNLVNGGAKLIATNSDMTGPIEGGIKPACKALVAAVEAATGKTAYFVGKPNPLMMRAVRGACG